MKILYFDYWTNGVHNFKNIDKLFVNSGNETMLFHLGSFRSKCPIEETLFDIKCRDISFYPGKYIYDILEEIKPDAVIVLNCSSLIDRSIVLSCRKLNIRTIFLMHGIRATGSEIDSTIKIYKRHYNNLFNKIKKATKYFDKIIPNYLYTLWKCNKKSIYTFGFVRVLYENFKNPSLNMFFPIKANEVLTDLCLVYSKKYIEYYQSLGFSKNQIKIVGNPAYDDLFKRIKRKNFGSENLDLDIKNIIKEGRKFAIYLEDGFVEQGNMGGWTKQFRNSFVNDIANRLLQDGYFLIVKLHPSSSNTDFSKKSENILFIKETDLNSLIYFSDFVIGHISTTINIALLLDKPVLIPNWSLAKNILDYYVKTGVANKWENILDKINLSINLHDREIYFEDSISILEPMANENIVSSILDLEVA